MPKLTRWTAEMDALLRECRDAGKSYYQMEMMPAFSSRGLTANAIIGRANRMGLVGATRPANHRAPRERANRPVKVKAPKVPRVIPKYETRHEANMRIAAGLGVPVLKPSVCEPIGGPVGWAMPDKRCCTWIFGDRTPERDARQWCGHPVLEGKSWCAEHYERTRAPRVAEGVS